MTFESLAVAGLSIGLTMTDIFELDVGFTYGLINQKCNEIAEANRRDADDSEKVIKGDAKMLMNM